MWQNLKQCYELLTNDTYYQRESRDSARAPARAPAPDSTATKYPRNPSPEHRSKKRNHKKQADHTDHTDHIDHTYHIDHIDETLFQKYWELHLEIEEILGRPELHTTNTHDLQQIQQYRTDLEGYDAQLGQQMQNNSMTDNNLQLARSALQNYDECYHSIQCAEQSRKEVQETQEAEKVTCKIEETRMQEKAGKKLEEELRKKEEELRKKEEELVTCKIEETRMQEKAGKKLEEELRKKEEELRKKEEELRKKEEKVEEEVRKKVEEAEAATKKIAKLAEETSKNLMLQCQKQEEEAKQIKLFRKKQEEEAKKIRKKQEEEAKKIELSRKKQEEEAKKIELSRKQLQEDVLKLKQEKLAQKEAEQRRLELEENAKKRAPVQKETFPRNQDMEHKSATDTQEVSIQSIPEDVRSKEEVHKIEPEEERCNKEDVAGKSHPKRKRGKELRQQNEAAFQPCKKERHKQEVAQDYQSSATFSEKLQRLSPQEKEKGQKYHTQHKDKENSPKYKEKFAKKMEKLQKMQQELLELQGFIFLFQGNLTVQKLKGNKKSAREITNPTYNS